MPEIKCGMDLQEAQNLVQKVTGEPLFFSRSEDATGQGRSQLVDRNWTVIRSTPPAGTPIKSRDPLFFVEKDSEFKGC